MSEPQGIELDYGWWATLQWHGPWLGARLHPQQENPLHGHGLIERLWTTASEWGAHDMVIDMHEVTFLPSILMGELVRLHKRLATHNGRLRICGLSHECTEALHACRLDQVLPTYGSLEEALH
jgi:anti-anti-sigma factor